MVLMMAYGLRGVSLAQFLVDDVDWQQAHIRIRAPKGDKEVVVPLMDAVGDALNRKSILSLFDSTRADKGLIRQGIESGR